MSSFTADLIVKVLSQEKDGQGLFEVYEGFTFDMDFLGSGETVAVPKGFVTDFATIPWFGRPWFELSGRVAKAALLHDYMLATNDPRAVKAFAQALEVAGVSKFKRWVMVTAVRLWSVS